MIYFIKAGDYIKVGYSKDEKAFKTRMSSYKTSCPFDVEVINKIEGGVEEEANILNYFIDFHCKGEWFYYDESIETFALNPYDIPKSNLPKPLHKGNKEVLSKLPEILKLYSEGYTLKELDKMFNIPRIRLTRYIPDDLRRGKEEWLRIKKQKISPNNLPIKCVETGEEFISISEASRHFKTTVTNIQRVCRGDRKSWNNLTFEFLEKEENN